MYVLGGLAQPITEVVTGIKAKTKNFHKFLPKILALL
jgi:hypothetical protein